MTIATDNVGNSRQMYIISCMNVPKQSQLVQKNEKLLLWCAQVTRFCGGWTNSFENFISVLRNAPKRLRKTVISWFAAQETCLVIIDVENSVLLNIFVDICFQYSLMNWKFRRTTFIWSSNLLKQCCSLLINLMHHS